VESCYTLHLQRDGACCCVSCLGQVSSLGFGCAGCHKPLVPVLYSGSVCCDFLSIAPLFIGALLVAACWVLCVHLADKFVFVRLCCLVVVGCAFAG
jgi:hypothetical protein